MPDPDRVVAGLSCRTVLTDLSAYVDGELAPGRVAQIEDHLRGCDWCERFGGEFAGVVRAFRRSLHEAAPVDASVVARLRARLDRESGTGDE